MKIIEVKENKKQYFDLLLLADEQEDIWCICKDLFLRFTDGTGKEHLDILKLTLCILDF